MSESDAIERGIQAITKALLARWPAIRWTIQGTTWAAGSQIDVIWEDGPGETEVWAVVGSYEFPHQAGPADLYVTKELPGGGAKFITLHRQMGCSRFE